MSDTPRTDAAQAAADPGTTTAAEVQAWEFARQFERELDSSNRLAASKTVRCCEYAAQIERLENALRHIAEHGYASKDWKFAQAVLEGKAVEEAREWALKFSR